MHRTITPRIINFLAFLSYTKLAHKDLTIPVAFAGIAVFNIVQMHLATLPGRVMFLLRTLISIRRLDKYLGEEEIERTAGATVSQTGSDSTRLGFEASTFQYPQHEVRDETAETFSLVCPAFDFPLGRLTLVAGDNASGKSSLLMALLGGECPSKTQGILSEPQDCRLPCRDGLHVRQAVSPCEQARLCPRNPGQLVRAGYNPRQHPLWRALRREEV